MNKFYITTSIVYATTKPHVGFAMELFQADAIARLHRLYGHDVFFLSGTDENGLKNYRKAKELGISPQEHVDEVSKLVKDFADSHQVSLTDFIRTTDQKRHWPAAQKLWQILCDKNLIEKKKYSGLYCVGCEKFMKETELDAAGNCPLHHQKPEPQSVENYFFKLSQFSETIYQKIKNNEINIIPGPRRNEILQVIENGLEDVSFSREKSQLPWGIPVPNDPEHVMYVWCDALTNYISALGYATNDDKFQHYWPADVHFIGKDIIRFHAGIWPGMLLAADLPLPKNILVHGFIHSGGQRMSKTTGNVIDPVEISTKYGPEALRLILLKEIPTFGDGDLTMDRIGEIYHSELANKLGNLVSRVIAMNNKYFAGQIPAGNYDQIINFSLPDPRQYLEGQNKFGQIDKYLHSTWEIIEAANQFVDHQKPWELAKNPDQTQLTTVILNLLETIRLIAMLLEPISPHTSQKILAAINQDYIDSSHHQTDPDKYHQLLQWGGLKQQVSIKLDQPLFPRLELEIRN
ncbi:MAG: methionine--tRNA ligase [Patescibacteria group bacterium]